MDAICEATLRCVARWGVTKTTLEDVAREAGVGRATVYRTFRGGKAHVLRAVLVREVDRFLAEVRAAVEAAPGELEDVVVAGVTTAARRLAGHEALAFLLAHEPDAVLPHVGFGRMGHLLDAAAAFADAHLAPFIADPDERTRAAQWLARVVLTYVFHPAAGADLTDEASTRRLLRTFVLPGLHAPTPQETQR